MARNRYDMDEILEDSFDINQLKRLAGYVSPYKSKMEGVIILMLSASALTMMVPIFFPADYGYLYSGEECKGPGDGKCFDAGSGLLFCHCHAI